jgi:tRNA (guanine-N7-)-methyltransferase
LELGCGRGEYAVNLALKFPEKNFIGVDWKGARLWRGAKTAFEENMMNVGFLRIQIQTFVHSSQKRRLMKSGLHFLT